MHMPLCCGAQHTLAGEFKHRSLRAEYTVEKQEKDIPYVSHAPVPAQWMQCLSPGTASV
ncbi:hypothetical protein TPADAL_0274a [Treponema pallidum subsp. pallidum DAL-1]|uniref:Uncharacterized protein n=2 Tax=Treponema pallidum TaxID=160 RepID=A0AAU8S0F2_TREPL|nr:hypothetical protein TPESAMD_0274a [Treponema pallidum subsp. pertenue str. SamoaD]AEZ58468.1 hypothetical protein TPECDC2_0274a [Treponema pallidum subsp. pertenue str. CDC2]AEZ59536.1 hypothetical protein TPEGAU_0274a [Treponema pallidum subsp. pertenue str. Gauthier]AEZ60600.1 hypothetical protein TPADAL_0274a [Treponema pallidum subsp. pallidum DAL-1]AGK83924.1 hypothetical protein TPFB_0274a [Treponema pallidum str. Fribourg-Blanc]AJB40299.1 hypothetical protein TENDBA_0274a [Treponema